MRSVIVLLLLVTLPALSFSATIYVPVDFSTIQQAIDAAANGDTILVASGTYVENIDFKGKAIYVKSEQGPSATIIDGNNTDSVVVFQTGESNSSVLDGFLIQYGHSYDGGGIYCSNNSSPKLINNIIRDNNADHNGGGIYCSNNSYPEISNNLIRDNNAANEGGGIGAYDSSPNILNNLIYRNWADDHGGGIFCQNSSPSITNNIIHDNEADDVDGGGICLWGCVEPALCTIANNRIFNNKADNEGAGIASIKSNVVITNNIIFRNIAGGGGGGVYITYNQNTMNVTNCIITENEAAAGGGGIYCSNYACPVITNTIIWNNPKGGNSEIHGGSGNPDVTFCDIKGGWPGVGNIDADPRFVDPDGPDNNPLTGEDNDYHLLYISPCRNTGNNSAPNIPVDDFEGDPRIAHGVVDMGADEFHTHLYYKGDATPGGIIEIKFIDIPGTSPIYLWLGSGVLNPPLNLPPHGEWYLQFPILLHLKFSSIPANGCYFFSNPVPYGLPLPLDLPFQAGIGIKLTNLLEMKIH